MQKLLKFEENANGAKAVFKNGLTVLVNETRAFPLVDISTYVKAGPLDEPDDAPGVSSAVQHLIYRRTSSRGSGEIAKDTLAMGGILRSSVDYDHSWFDTVVPSEQWKKALEIQADALMNPLFDPEELKRELALISEEGKLRLDNPDTFVLEMLLALGFPHADVRQAVPEAVRDLARETVMSYHKSRYIAPRTVLVINGDITTSEVLNEVARLYEKLPGGNAANASFSGGEQSEFRYREVPGNIEIPQILFGFHTASAASDDFPALEVLNAMIGTGDGSLISRNLLERKHIIVSGNSQLLANPEFGYLVLRLETQPKEVDRSEIAALTELEILKREEPDAAEMERAFGQLEQAHWSRMQTVSDRAQAAAYFESLGDWKKMVGHTAKLRQVKPADVVRVAKKYLRLDNCSLIEYMPANSESRNLSAENARRTLQDLLDPATDQEISERERATVPAIDLPAASATFTPNEVRYPLQAASILRGPELYIREEHIAPLIQIGFFFPGGKFFETKENSGVTELTLRSMLRSHPGKTPEQFFRQLEVYGGRVTPVVADDYFGFLFTILSRNVEKGLDLLGEVIRNPKFDKDEVGRQRELQLAALSGRKTHADTHLRFLLEQVLFKDHPYALSSEGTTGGLATLNAGSVQAWYQERIKNRKPLIIILGDTPGTNLAGYFVRHFSGSRFEEVKIPETFAKPLESRVSLEEDSKNTESAIGMAFQAPPVGDEDAYALAVASTYIAAKFDEELRDRQGLAAEVSTVYAPRIRGAEVLVAAAVSRANEDAAIKGLETELRRLSENPLPYKEYRTALNATVGKYWIDRQARFWQIFAIAGYVLAGKGLDGYQDYPNLLKEVKQEEIQDIARRILNPEKAVTVKLHAR